ncbi:MAG: serine/threonine-protein kinase [Bryobacteraceae bacterium]
MSFQVGEIVGDYEIISVLGAGGMGSVYKVRNQISDRTEAMKILLPNLKDVPELADRFLREIKVQGRLEHPNITALRTAVRSGNQLLMIMEYVDGQSLDVRLQRGPVTVHQATQCVLQVLNALEYAHSMGVVHRDLKPANIMITPQGTVKLTDFGIARMGTDQKLTRTGVAMGSLYYMSPEQIQGKEADHRADLYSLGATLYELATGQRPFGGDTEFAIMCAHLEQQPVHPMHVNPRVPQRLGDVILQALEKDPDLRYQDAAEFREALLGAGATLRTAAISTRNITSAITTPGALANRGATKGPSPSSRSGAPVPSTPTAAPAPPTATIPPPPSTSRWVMRGIAAGVLIVLAGGLAIVRLTGSRTAAATPAATAAQQQAPATAAPPPESQAAPTQARQAQRPAEEPAPRETRGKKPVQEARLREPAIVEHSPAAVQPAPASQPQHASTAPAALPAAAPPPQSAPQPPSQQKAPEAPARDPRAEEWEHLKATHDPSAIEAYRRRYPDGPFATQALRRQEQLEWDTVKNSANVPMLRAFRERFANSPFVADAAAEIDRLERDSAKAHILEALGQYRSAFERRDIGTVRSLRPGLSGAQAKSIEQMFRDARSIEMRLQPIGAPAVNGGSASLQCRVSQTFVMKNGDRLPANSTISVQFRKSGNSWVIDSIQ